MASMFGGILLIVVVFFDRRSILLKEADFSHGEAIRVVEFAPRGRIFSDYFIYRCEYYRGGYLWSCSSSQDDSTREGGAIIKQTGDGGWVVSRLNGDMWFAIGHNGIFLR